MGRFGMGVMIGMLAGNSDSADAFGSAIGKTIASVVMHVDGGAMQPHIDEYFTPEDETFATRGEAEGAALSTLAGWCKATRRVLMKMAREATP